MSFAASLRCATWLTLASISRAFSSSAETRSSLISELATVSRILRAVARIIISAIRAMMPSISQMAAGIAPGSFVSKILVVKTRITTIMRTPYMIIAYFERQKEPSFWGLIASPFRIFIGCAVIGIIMFFVCRCQ